MAADDLSLLEVRWVDRSIKMAVVAGLGEVTGVSLAVASVACSHSKPGGHP